MSAEVEAVLRACATCRGRLGGWLCEVDVGGRENSEQETRTPAWMSRDRVRDALTQAGERANKVKREGEVRDEVAGVATVQASNSRGFLHRGPG